LYTFSELGTYKFCTLEYMIQCCFCCKKTNILIENRILRTTSFFT